VTASLFSIVTQPITPTMGVAQLRDIIARLTAIVTEENSMLESDHGVSLESIIQKKGQLLLELMRSQKNIQPDVLRTHLRHDLFVLRNVMAENKRKLTVHYSAAKDITDSILDVMRYNESDGTYQGWSPGGQVHQ
jgi:hypothetical protein